MKRFVVLGSTGMVGSEIVRILSNYKHQVIEINTKGASRYNNTVYKFDVLNDSIELLENALMTNDFVVNCIGLIRHRIADTEIQDHINAIKINSIFPKQLAILSNKKNIKIVQPSTDCVFSGVKGNYNESDSKDATDIYGLSKIIGETSDKNILNLRCSIIGKELSKHIELMDWAINQAKNGAVTGYVNHFWNGLTSMHFAKIVIALFESNETYSGTYHLIPKDHLSKFELIKVILEVFNIDKDCVSEMKAAKHIDRTLLTEYESFNKKMWRIAGYETIPTIKNMLLEYKTSLAEKN